jgi:type II secretory pathway pseudopilin PulG
MRKQVFTLIELIIFLVILGTVLGIFLNFSNKVQISEVQAIISSVKKYNVATNSFMEKYGELPGDIKKTKILGITDNNTDGNQNGIIEDAEGINGRKLGSIRRASGEVTNFWMHLSKSSFLKENFDGKDNGNIRLEFTFPRIGNEDYGITVFGYNGENYYQIGVVGANKNNILMSDEALRPFIAFSIDKKIDDGVPMVGVVIAVNGVNFVNGYRSIKKECVDADGYNMKYKEPACQLRIKMLEM